MSREIELSEATFYRWKQLYGGLMPSEVKKLRQLEEENTPLRRVVADLTLDSRVDQPAALWTFDVEQHARSLSKRRPSPQKKFGPALDAGATNFVRSTQAHSGL
jgi:Transposase